jgi:hypothetical protein
MAMEVRLCSDEHRTVGDRQGPRFQRSPKGRFIWPMIGWTSALSEERAARVMEVTSTSFA